VRLLKRKPRSFDVQVHDVLLRITVSPDLEEESRAAALSFWEQIQSWSLQHPEFRTSKSVLQVPQGAPDIVREMVGSAAAAGVGPTFTVKGALADLVGRFLATQVPELTVAVDGSFFIVTRKRMKLTVHRPDSGSPLSIVVDPRREGVGVATTLGARRAPGADGWAVLATSTMLAEAATAGLQALLPKPDGFRSALAYLQKVPGVLGGLVVSGERIGVAGGVEIAA